ncbi:NAD-dependent epimerase/dehydratase family protein [Candidatus Parcubacteria bacterium]|nr:NAD-dependent epimerase/dehydratase family protein [Patescibacteria group bacterium]MCG2689520.1 NAD-dependent epimerase/dehydratase family protein [Candidatus Parcubacteria bacterium]
MENLKSKKILVTGASGFVGQNLVHNLESLGATVCGLDETVDLRDFEQIKGAFLEFNPEVVFHLGALVDLSRDFKVAQNCVDINIKGALNVLEACVQAKVSKIVFMSTQEVYGNSKTPYKENQPLLPPSPYAISKVAGESFCKYYKTVCNLDYSIVRMSTAYGSFQQNTRLIPTIINKALRGENIDLNSGQKERDYIFVEDAVSGLVKIALSKKALGLEFNLGGGKSYKLEYLARKIVELCKSKSTINLGVFPDRVGEADMMLSSIARAKEILGWQPENSLENGLLKTINWFKNG